MCLILFAYKQHPDYPLLLIANRDEFYRRPTQDAHWWDDHPGVFAGRDLQSGGTWLGVNQQGNFAAVTNYREPGAMTTGALSRGELTSRFLATNPDPESYLAEIHNRADQYSGFNLLIGNSQQLWFYSNREPQIKPVEAGVFGICNGLFDEPWPKLESGRTELQNNLAADDNALFDILQNSQTAKDEDLPDTGVSIELEKLLSSRFIRSAEYGTRACTLVKLGSERGEMTEQNFIDSEETGKRVKIAFDFNH